MQEHAYVLLPTEKEVPADLQAAFTKTNQLQDFLTNEFAIGKSGNAILKQALTNAKAAGINPSIYTHPIDFMDTQRAQLLACGIFKMGFQVLAITR